MRLMLVGTLQGHITEAGRIAMARGAKVSHAEDGETAVEALRNGKGADLVLIDVRLDVGGFIKQIRAERITVPVIAFGIGNDANAAVRAIRAGAKEYLPLPPDAELIAAVLEAVSEENETVVVSDPVMQASLDMAAQIAPSDATVLIRGESGTGKEVMARFLHRKSKRADGTFVSVNCAAIPEQLLESELFGHEKGAFTGAVARRIGKFEEANGGTLLLDEISEMHPRLQAKLLRAIQEREIDRVGGSSPVKVDIRLLATTNRNLEDEVQAGNFREDLYFRLNVIALTLPSLRDRPQDIPALAKHFIRKYSASNGIDERALSEDAMAKLMAHPWRGNVRELENTMHRAVLLARGETIGAEAVLLTGQSQATSPKPGWTAAATAPAAEPAPVHTDSGAISAGFVGKTMAQVEQDLIIGTLNHCLGNRTHAANILGISIRTLRNKLREYGENGVPVPPHAGESTGHHAVA
jgi:DNA-binding NtrC family response regulator